MWFLSDISAFSYGGAESTDPRSCSETNAEKIDPRRELKALGHVLAYAMASKERKHLTVYRDWSGTKNCEI